MSNPDRFQISRLKQLAGLALAAAAVAIIGSCGGDAPPTSPDTAPSAAKSVVTISAASIASGSQATITIQAKNAAGSNVTAGGATVTVGLNSGGTSGGTFSAITDNTNGTYTATLTGSAAGTARSIVATINGATITTTMPTVTVTPGPGSAAQSLITVGSPTVIVGSTTTLTVQLKDAAGNTVTTGGATIAFTLSGTGTSAGTIGATTDNANGTYTATFTATTAGTARAIGATIAGTAVTTTLPTITVNVAPAGPISATTSVVTVSAASVASGSTVTIILQGKDAAGVNLAIGGATITFALSGTGTSTGTIGTVTDNANGTYSATFTATTAGTARNVTATVNGTAVATTSPTVTVFAQGITLSTTTIAANATQGLAALSEPIGVFANGGSTAAGLTATVAYTSPGVGVCQTANWLGTPTFDVTTANPIAILTLNPTAVALGIYSCTATVTVASTTAGVASQQITVTLAVARGAVAQTAVNLVMMGNAGDPSVQLIAPDVKVLITNGGRGIVTGLHATITDQSGTGATNPWLTGPALSWTPVATDTNARTAPSTLVVHAQVARFAASANIHVTGTGMPEIVIPVSVLFNTNPELVTNPRGAVINAIAAGANVSTSVIAFNQNRTLPDSFYQFSRDASVALPSWLTVSVVGLSPPGGKDTAATVTLTANPTGLLADSIMTATVRLKALGCSTANLTAPCTDNSSSRTFDLPVTLVLERGLVVSATNATLFAPVGTATVTRDLAITNGGSTAISGLSANAVLPSWLTASFVGGTAAPTTLRLTADPTGQPRGTVLTTTVTISASSPTGVPSRTVQVTLRVY